MLQYFDTLTDDSGNALLGATVVVTAYPGGGPATIYLTNGTASPIANSTVVADITGQISFYAPDGVYILTYAYKSVVYKTRSPVQMLDPTGFISIADTGAANAYVVTDSRLSAQLYVGMKVEILIAHTNTGASTLNVNSTGALPFQQPGGAALAAGMAQGGGLVRAEWDGARWQMLATQSQPSFLATPQEIAAGVTITNNTYQPLNPWRYGADGTGGANDIAAFAAVNAVLAQISGLNLFQNGSTALMNDVRRYGAKGDGVTDDSAAFTRALTEWAGKAIYVPTPAVAYLITAAGITVPTNTAIIGDNKRTCKFLAGANIDLFTLNDGAQLYRLYAEGNATTGHGVTYVAGAGNNTIMNCRFINFAPSATVTFTGSVSAATSGTLTAGIANGTYSFIFPDGEVRLVTVTGTTAVTWSGALYVTVMTTALIADGVMRFPDNNTGSRLALHDVEIWQTGASNGTPALTGTGKTAVYTPDVFQNAAVPKKFAQLETSGSPAFFFGGCNDLFIGESFLADLIWSTNSRSVQLSGSNRVANQIFMIIKGANHSFGANDVLPQLILDSSLSNSVVGPQSLDLGQTTSYSMTGATQANPCVVTINTVAGSNPIKVGQFVTFDTVGGMTQLNQTSGQVTSIGGVSGAYTATVQINASAFTAYTSGGNMSVPAIVDNTPANNTVQVFSFRQVYNPQGTNTNFAIGNGSLQGYFSRGGSQTFVVVNLTVGTTTNLGTGALTFTLPVAKQDGEVICGGNAVINHAGSLFTAAIQIPGNVGTFQLIRDTSGSVTAASPAALASGDTIRMSFTYEP